MSAARLNPLRWQRRFWLALCLSLLALAARAFAPPAFQGDVLDQAGLLSAEERATLSQRIAELRSQDGIWAAVFIAASLQGDSIENAALKTFEQWRLGRADKDNGLLVMVAPNERKMRIEVGYGLEGTLTDALSKRIVIDIYQPAFRENRYADGLLAELTGGDPAEQSAQLDGAIFLQRLLVLWLGNLLFPLLYWLISRRRVPKSTDLGRKTRTAFVLFAFFGFFFGVFFGVFSQVFSDAPEIAWGLLGANALFGLVFGLPALFGKPGQGGGSGTTYSNWDSVSSSSSWRSGDSDSSSSGGGSSGGGGASGDY